jgi:hypothetical protein
MRGREYRDHAQAHIKRVIHPDTAPTVKLRKEREILNDPAYMPLISLAAE